MKKVLSLLEQHVQWVALSLGVVYLLFMVWSYFLQERVVITIGPDTYTPARVDDFILQKAEKLQHDIKSTEAPNWKVKASVDDWSKRICGEPNVPALTGPWMNSVPFYIAANSKTTTPLEHSAAKVESLPKPPRAVVMNWVRGRGTCRVPEAGNPSKVTSMEKDWVSLAFKVDMAQLDAELKRVNIPSGLRSSLILQVELIRDEQLPTGQWSEPTVIATLTRHRLMAMPADNAPKGRLFDYLNFANQNNRDIVRPAFYDIEKGDAWVDPSTAPPANSVVPVVKPVEVVKPAVEPPKKQPKNVPPVRPAKPARTSMNGRAFEGYASPRVEGRTVGYLIMGADEAAAPTPPATAPANPKMPFLFGLFDPSKVEDAIIIAHDDTAQPSKTYRYRLRYKIKNPLFNSAGVKMPAEFGSTLALAAEESENTPPITVPARVRLFLAKNFTPGTSATFKVFRWKDGTWANSKEFTVAIGDVVAGGDPDFNTNWTLVDLRPDPRGGGENTAVLVDEDNHLSKRSFSGDRVDIKEVEP